MKITFWSPVHGQCKTTSNMIAVAVYYSLKNELKNAIMQTHFKFNQLEDALLGKQDKVVGEFFQDMGMDVLARSIRSEPLDKDTIINSSIAMLNGKLNLIPGTNKSNKEHYHEKLEPVLLSIIKGIEECHDIVFIDTNSGYSDSLTNKIIETADLVVINLCQNANILEFFRDNPFTGKNVFYIIGNYDPNSRYTISNIRRKYKHIKKEHIASIPYNTAYMDSISDAEVFSFFERYLDSKKGDKNKEFIDSVKDTSEKILKIINMNRRDLT